MSLHPLFQQILAAHGMPQSKPPLTEIEKRAIVGRIFDDRSACYECPRYERRQDTVPYSEGWVRKSYERCSLGDYASDRAEDCPGFEAATGDCDE